jgi:hypothetical protein
MKRWHGSFFATSSTTRRCGRQYSLHSAARAQHGVDQFADRRIARECLAYGLSKAATPDALDVANAEGLQRSGATARR